MTDYYVAAPAWQDADAPIRTPTARHYAMTPPAFFAVEYAINPWMDTTAPVDVHLAMAQWERLRETYLRLGHRVDLVEPVPGLPDMVYAANGGFIADDIAVVARFRFAERAGESKAYSHWMSSIGYRPVSTRHVNEGQGDLLMVGDMVLAGYGFRTDQRAHAEIAAALRMPVVSLELVDPRFYHLDTALAVLDEHTIAYYPPAFSAGGANSIARVIRPRHHRRHRRRLPVRTQRRLRRPACRASRRRNGFRSPVATTPASSRSASICPSYSRAAAR